MRISDWSSDVCSSDLLPVLVRFVNILHDRVDQLTGAFADVIAELGYQGQYTAVYPIKVNQQGDVVEEIVRHGGERVGIEAGSKPELAAVLGLARPGSVIVRSEEHPSELQSLMRISYAAI